MCSNCNEKEKYYITTAIAYTSGKPHIGNTYEFVLADAIARYKRSKGYDVYFQTGTDEHGQKIELKAEEAGVTPKEFVDNVSGEIKRIWDLMNTSYDKFIRTTMIIMRKKCRRYSRNCMTREIFTKDTTKGMYCTPCESFFTESQLVDGKCPDCGRPVQPAKEEAYFFKMSKYADRLIDYINTHPDFIQPVSRKNEMMNNFLLPGLQDLCVSRTSFSWGIPVDFDPKHVVYVWLDASQTISQKSVTILTDHQSFSRKTGLQICTLSEKISCVSTLFTGLFSLWHLTFHFQSRYSDIHGCFRAVTR